jgi:flagellar hook-length control protein FliK
VASVALATPVYSPEFAQVLCAQVSVLAQGGVQRAELQLNPADMGPISVQIELDGKQARVDFGAEVAATRTLIQHSLPELASALQAQGLSLSGAGVFEQPPERRGNAPAAGAERSLRRAAAVAASTPRTLAVSAPQGTIDLYA